MGDLISRNEIIDILAKMKFFQGQRAGRELWNDKSVEVQDEDIKNFNRDIQTIRKYILQLEEKSKWIPCSVQLPETPEFGDKGYLVQQKHVCEPFSAYWNGSEWSDSDNERLEEILAWMPLPERYIEKNKGGTKHSER